LDDQFGGLYQLLLIVGRTSANPSPGLRPPSPIGWGEGRGEGKPQVLPEFTGSWHYFLQSNTNLISGASWVSNTTLPVIRGTQYQMTNSLAAIPRHYRLRKTLPPPAFGPLMSVNLAGAHVQIFWPTNPAGFALQSTPAVLPVSWTYVFNTPALTAGLYQVSLPNTSTWRFFRLIYTNPN